LDTYVHLLDDGVGGGLELSAELPSGEHKVRTDGPVTDGTTTEATLVPTP
jgi:hypothetical protein